MENKYKIFYSTRYKKSIKKLKPKEIEDVEKIIDLLAKDEKLDRKYKDHALKGKFKAFRECHVKPDLLLIYQKDKEVLILTAVNVGSHSDLF